MESMQLELNETLKPQIYADFIWTDFSQIFL